MRPQTTSHMCGARDYQALTAYAAGFAYVALCTYARHIDMPLPSLCPWRALGPHCPGCGMTRAFGCLLTGNYLAATQYNPLILLVAPYVTYVALDLIARVATGRSQLPEMPQWFASIYQLAFVAGCCVLGVVRFLSWLMPSWNPLQIGLPGP